MTTSKWNFSLLPTLFHWRNHEDHWVAWSLKYFQIQIFSNRNIFLESPFIPSQQNFKSFKIPINHSIINQTIIYFNYYNIPKFRILGCYKLPHLKWISSSRFEEASKKRLGVGGLLANILVGKVRGATTLKSKVRVPINSGTSSGVPTISVSSHILQ